MEIVPQSVIGVMYLFFYVGLGLAIFAAFIAATRKIQEKRFNKVLEEFQ